MARTRNGGDGEFIRLQASGGGFYSDLFCQGSCDEFEVAKPIPRIEAYLSVLNGRIFEGFLLKKKIRVILQESREGASRREREQKAAYCLKLSSTSKILCYEK